MKYFIAFLLLVFAPSLVPNTAFAAINSTRVITHSTISPPKKLTFKEKLLRKLYKKGGDANEKANNKASLFLLIGVLLLIFGIALLVSGENKSKAATNSGYDSLLGLGDFFSGTLLSTVGLGFLLSGYARKRRLTKAAKKES